MTKRTWAGIVVGTSIVLAASVGASAAKVKLEAWTFWGSGPMYENFKTACTMYEKVHPNVAINVTVVSYGGDKLKAAAAAGVSPDITFIDGNVLDSAPRYAYFVKPLTPYLTKDGLYDSYLKPSIDLFSWEGIVYGLPWTVDPNFSMVFNADAFDQVGLPGRGPETPDDVTLYNAKLMQRDGNGKATRMGIIPWRFYGEAQSLIIWGLMWGKTQLSDGNYYTLTNPNTLKALDYWMAFGDRFGGMKQMDAFGGKAYTDLKSVAMQPMVLSDLQATVRLNKTMKIGIAEMPGTKDGVSAVCLGGEWLGIGIHSKHSSEAWDFIKFATTDLGVAKATANGRFSASKSAYSKGIYNSTATDDTFTQLRSFYAKIAPKGNRYWQPVIWDNPGLCALLRKITIDRQGEKVAALTDFSNRLNKRIDAILKKTIVIPSKRK